MTRHGGSRLLSRTHLRWQLLHLLVQGGLAIVMDGTSHLLLAGSVFTLAAVGAMFALTEPTAEQESPGSTATTAAGPTPPGSSTTVRGSSPPRGDD